MLLMAHPRIRGPGSVQSSMTSFRGTRLLSPAFLPVAFPLPRHRCVARRMDHGDVAMAASWKAEDDGMWDPAREGEKKRGSQVRGWACTNIDSKQAQSIRN